MIRYVNDQFNEKHLSTIQAAFMKKKLRIGKNTVELAIWVEYLINNLKNSLILFKKF